MQSSYIRSPQTGRLITVGGPAYKKLVSEGKTTGLSTDDKLVIKHVCFITSL